MKIPKNAKIFVIESLHFKQVEPNLAYPEIHDPHNGPSYPNSQVLYNPPLKIRIYIAKK